jgi:predicted transcriptional regulator of viral defense system
VKGSGTVGQFEQLDQLLETQDGMLRTAQVVSAGISKPVFYDYVHSRELERVAHGIYLSKDAWVDAMYLLHLRVEQAVFSHETALFFHDLTDREPLEYTVTVKTGYNPSKLKAEGVQVFTIKAELHGVGLTTAQTPFGHTVPVYDLERTICDLLRSRNNMEMQTFQGALKMYARRKDKDLRTLMRYAGMFRVEKILRQYLEVLL